MMHDVSNACMHACNHKRELKERSHAHSALLKDEKGEEGLAPAVPIASTSSYLCIHTGE